MIEEFAWMVEQIKRRIIPVGVDGLNEQLENTVHISLFLQGAARFEYVEDNQLQRTMGPKMTATGSREEFNESMEKWLHQQLLPHLEKWTDRCVREILPDVLLGLTVLTGFDVEKHLVIAGQRGACNVCNVKCKMVETQMWHMRIGTGVLIVTLEGMSMDKIASPPCPKPVFNIPNDAPVVVPSGCEARSNWVIPETFRYLAKTFLSEATSGALPIAFNAEGAERDQVNDTLVALGVEEIGLRVAESSSFVSGSVANATLTKYEDTTGEKPKQSLNAQAEWVSRRSLPKNLWSHVDAQKDFSLSRVRTVGKNHTEKMHNKAVKMAYLYHCLDNVAPSFITQVALAKFIASHPLVLILGNNKFVEELTDIVIEILGRLSVKPRVWYHAQKAKLPDSLEELFEIVDDLHNKSFENRCAAYRAGAYALVGVQRSEMPRKRKIDWSVATRRVGERSIPDVIAGTGKNKRKNDGFQLEAGETYLTNTNIKCDQRVAEGIDNFETGGGSSGIVESQMRPNFAERQVLEDDVEMSVNKESPEKRRKEDCVEDQPATKKFGVATKDNDNVPKVGGELNANKVREITKLFPSIAPLVKMVLDSEEITAAEFEVITEQLNTKVAKIHTDDHVGKLNAYNDDKTADKEREINKEKSRLQRLKDRMKERNLRIVKLQNEQRLDKENYSRRSAEVRAKEAEEELRRKLHRNHGVRKLEKRKENALKASQMLMEAAASKVFESPKPAKMKATLTMTLSRIEGKTSSEPVHVYLADWNDQETYDKWRSQVVNTSSVVTSIMNNDVFKEALKLFEDEKNNKDKFGSLCGVGTILANNRRTTRAGNRSWVLCHDRMELLKVMKNLHKESQEEVPPRLWTDEEINNAELSGEESKAKKLADNRHINGKALATSLAAAFSQATAEVTGEDLLDVELWYYDEQFQRDYNNMFKEGQRIMTNAAADDGYEGYINSYNQAKRKMEALMSERQVSPVAIEDCAALSAYLKIQDENVEIIEEDVDDNDANDGDVSVEDISSDENHGDRQVIEVDYEDMEEIVEERTAAHLRKY